MHVIYEVEMKRICETVESNTNSQQTNEFADGKWPLFVELTNGEFVGCDLLIEATGVRPNSDLWSNDCDQVVAVTDSFEVEKSHAFRMIHFC